jgi:hypothetical protein
MHIRNPLLHNIATQTSPTCKAMDVAHMRLAHNVLLIYIQRKLKGAVLPILERCRNRLF